MFMLLEKFFKIMIDFLNIFLCGNLDGIKD